MSSDPFSAPEVAPGGRAMDPPVARFVLGRALHGACRRDLGTGRTCRTPSGVLLPAERELATWGTSVSRTLWSLQRGLYNSGRERLDEGRFSRETGEMSPLGRVAVRPKCNRADSQARGQRSVGAQGTRADPGRASVPCSARVRQL